MCFFGLLSVHASLADGVGLARADRRGGGIGQAPRASSTLAGDTPSPASLTALAKSAAHGHSPCCTVCTRQYGARSRRLTRVGIRCVALLKRGGLEGAAARAAFWLGPQRGSASPEPGWSAFFYSDAVCDWTGRGSRIKCKDQSGRLVSSMLGLIDGQTIRGTLA